MTKKKRELIDILLDNVKPEDWPENFPFAAQDKIDGNIWAYAAEPAVSCSLDDEYTSNSLSAKLIVESVRVCKHWNKTIVHRDEFMMRCNERHRVFVAVTNQPPEAMDSEKYEALEFTEIGGVKEDQILYESTKLKTPLVQSVDSEGWIKWNGGEMPVEKGVLIDVKYRDGVVNLHVKAGIGVSTGSVTERTAAGFYHDGRKYDIIAYRLHAPRQQKTPQQLALEKFGTDWHDNEGVQPFSDTSIKVDLEFKNGTVRENVDVDSSSFKIPFDTPEFTVSKWRIHSDEKESQDSEKEKIFESLSQPMTPCSEEIPCHFVDAKDGPMTGDCAVKSPLSTQIGGDHYTKLAIQPMQYSMKNGLDPLQHTIIKYVTRFRDKAGIEDLEKAKHCIDMLIEFEKESK